MKKAFILVLSLFTLMMPAVVIAEKDCFGKVGEYDCPRIDTMLDHRKDLKLSRDQASKLEALFTELRTNGPVIAKDLKTLQANVQNMIADPNSDTVALKDTLKKISDIELRINLAKIDAYEKAYPLLNAEQKALFGSIWARSMQSPKKTK